MTDFHIRTDCRLCDAPLGLVRVLDLGETALANEYPKERGPQDTFPLYLQQCPVCEHVQLPVVVKPERLFPPDYPYKSGTNPVFRAHLKEFAATVSGMLHNDAHGNAPTLLEIASNDGTLLREFKALRVHAGGIDPAASGADGCRGFFSRQWAEEHKWSPHSGSGVVDCIVALNVFAHVDDLNDFTAGVAALLPEDGLFVLEVGYLPDVIERGLFDVVYHEHLSYHHLRPLESFFRKHGMSLHDAHRVDSQGGSIRCFVRKGDWFMTNRLKALLAAEECLSVEPLKEKIWNTKHSMFVLGGLRLGATFAGFGAPAKLTTLLAACSTQVNGDSASPRVIYDDNPEKVGRFTPGTGIPIVPSAQLLEDQPDYLILFSWNFAGELIPRLRALGYRGKIVVPLPEFKVLE